MHCAIDACILLISRTITKMLQAIRHMVHKPRRMCRNRNIGAIEVITHYWQRR